MVASSQIPLGGKLCILFPAFLAILSIPLAFGGVTPPTLLFCDVLLLTTVLLWVVCTVAEKRVPTFSRWIVGSLATLGILSVFQLINAQPDPANGREASWWPGTIDRTASLYAFRHGVALGLTLLVFIDLASDRTVRWWMLRVIALSGLIVALIGISQRAGNSPTMLWSTPEQSGNWFFGAFHYHANAGAFLNLCWPAALALWLKYCHQEGSGFHRSLWLSVLFITFLAVFVNTSKGAQLIAFVLFAIVLIRFQKVIFWKDRNWKVTGASAMAIVIAGFFLILPGIMTMQDRWSIAFQENGSFFGRLEMYFETIMLLPASGFWGTGAGTFRYLFPDFIGAQESGFSGIYLHAHHDYLQALVEWGVPGALALFLPVLVGLQRAIRRAQLTARCGSLEFSTSCAIIAVLGILAHASFDFPCQVPAIQIVGLAFLSFLWSGNAPRSQHHAPSLSEVSENSPEPEVDAAEEEAEMTWDESDATEFDWKEGDAQFSSEKSSLDRK